MRANSNVSLQEIEKCILGIEKFVFDSRRPIRLEKVDTSSGQYDPQYDQNVRCVGVSYIGFLNDLFEEKKSHSKCWKILNELEEMILSPIFYRRAIFGKKLPCVNKIRKEFETLLWDEISFVESNCTEDEYQWVFSNWPNIGLGTTKTVFIQQLRKIYFPSLAQKAA